MYVYSELRQEEIKLKARNKYVHLEIDLSMESSGNEEYERAIACYQARDEEIEKKKMEVRERVESQLNRAEQLTKRLAQVWDELEVLTDPMRKEVGAVRKRIDLANRDLKALGLICQKKEKEYKEAMDAFQEKNNEKAQLTNTLVELVNQSEKFRMNKLHELANILNSNS